MAKRSLQASPTGIQQAKRAYAVNGWTQENLAGEANLKTRQPIWRFFTGQPVDRQVFMEICFLLVLDWREITVNLPAEFLEPGEITEATQNIDALVQQVRSQRHETIQNQCGIVQLLDISRPVIIDDIYVDINIVEDIASQQCFEVTDLQNLQPDQFDRAEMGSIEQKQITGMQAVETYSKLRILGKLGVGKTTFLQYLTIQCDRGAIAKNRVPIFLILRDFAEESRDNGKFNLMHYLQQTFISSGISNLSKLETLLKEGRVLLLLDGMDEVLNQDMNSVLREIRKFSEKYYKNQFVVTCRTAAQKPQLCGFTDVEIAPFAQAQITTFVRKWFSAFANNNSQSGYAQSMQFIRKLDLPENWQFRQLVSTPLFLHLACWVFRGQERFLNKRTEFYKKGLDLLLGKWDEAKGIGRDDLSRCLLLPQKLRMLSQLAAVTFERGQYFFDQSTLEQYIGDYLQSLPGPTLPPEELQIESKALLKVIETHHGLLTERAHGIFSFSYIAFQEYFTARKIVASHSLQALEQALEGLVSHITDPNWREVFLLTVSMLRSADSLVQLMKHQIDALVTQDPYLQEFLKWTSQKTQTISTKSQVADSSAFYLVLARWEPYKLAQFALARMFDQGMLLDMALDNLLIESTIDHSQDFSYACSNSLNHILIVVLDAEFYRSLQQIKDQIPNQNQEDSQKWWQLHYVDWVEQLRVTIDHYRNINHSWQFSLDQQILLQCYYDASRLLVDCLNSKCQLSADIRQEIEATLLLPQKELKDKEWT